MYFLFYIVDVCEISKCLVLESGGRPTLFGGVAEAADVFVFLPDGVAASFFGGTGFSLCLCSCFLVL